MAMALIASSLLPASSPVQTRLGPARSWRGQHVVGVTAKLDIGKPLQYSHRIVTRSVQRYGNPRYPDVVHASREASLDVLEAQDGGVSMDFGAKVHVVALQVEDVADSRRRALRRLRSVDCDSRAVTLAFEFHLVPTAVRDVHGGHADNAFAATQVETVLHHAADDL